MLFQRCFVAAGIIALPVFPASKVNAHQFKRHRAHGGLMALFASSLLLVKCVGPPRLADGVAGVFLKGLASELGAAVAHLNYFALAALFFDRRDAIELLRFLGAGKAIP